MDSRNFLKLSIRGVGILVIFTVIYLNTYGHVLLHLRKDPALRNKNTNVNNKKYFPTQEVRNVHPICPFTEFKGRKKQVLHYMNLPQSKHQHITSSNFLKFFNYTVTRESKINSNFTMFQIDEVLKGNISTGGTMFEVLIAGEMFVRKCPVMDFFNGTYVSCCPVFKSCSNITIRVMFVTFSPFWINVPSPINFLIWQGTICSNEKANEKFQQCTVRQITSSYDNGYLLHLGKEKCKKDCWRWAVGNCVVSRKEGRWKECAKKYRSIYFIGDSQMRYSYYHAVNEAGLMTKPYPPAAPPAYPPVHFDIGNIHYQFTSFVEDAEKGLKQVLKEIANKSTWHYDIIILHWGSWDASYRYKNKKQDIFKGFIPALRKTALTINETVLNEVFSNVTIIWVTCPSAEYSHRKRCMRNPYDLGALAALSYDEIKNITGVKILDMYTITNIRNEDTQKCHQHYICRASRDKASRGSIGKVYMDVLNYLMCDYGTLKVDQMNIMPKSKN